MTQAAPLEQSDYLARLLSNLAASGNHSSVTTDDARLLLAIGEAYTAIAQVKLAELSEGVSEPSNELDGFAKALLKGRRDRERRFGPTIFGEPAWDILLELYVLKSEGMNPPISSIGHGVVAPTTMLRWMDRLTDQKLIRRVADARDARRTKIELTDRATAGVRSSLQTIFADMLKCGRQR